MTIYRDKKNGQEYGTYKIERVVLGTRLRLTTTTKDQRVARQIEDMLLEIKDYGRTDLLDRMVRSKNKSRTLMEFWTLHKRNKLFTHDPEKELHNSLPLREELLKWMRTHSGWNEKTRKDFNEKISTLFSRTQTLFPNPSLEDSPKVLREYRRQCEDRGSHSTFIHVRSVFLRFFRSQYGKSHDLSIRVTDVETLSKPHTDPSGTKGSKTVEQIEKLSKVLPPKYRQMLWTICTLGVGWKEYESIEVRDDIKYKRVYVVGTKMDKKDKRRRREVPYVLPPHGPVCTERTFRKVLKEYGKKVRVPITTYSLRHSYARWMEECGVPRWRVQMYMGHQPKTQTQKYQTTEVWRWLIEDAEVMRKWLATQREKAHVSVNNAIIANA